MSGAPMPDVDHFAKRLLTECLAGASRAQWLKRAQEFEAARPQPGEFTGRATRQELSQRWVDLTEVAAACRARAEVCAPDLEGIAPEVEAVWSEAS